MTQHGPFYQNCIQLSGRVPNCCEELPVCHFMRQSIRHLSSDWCKTTSATTIRCNNFIWTVDWTPIAAHGKCLHRTISFEITAMQKYCTSFIRYAVVNASKLRIKIKVSVCVAIYIGVGIVEIRLFSCYKSAYHQKMLLMRYMFPRVEVIPSPKCEPRFHI